MNRVLLVAAVMLGAVAMGSPAAHKDNKVGGKKTGQCRTI